MKINFISKNKNLNRGSYRIHIRDLNAYLNECGFDSQINSNHISDVNILDKGLCPSISKGKLTGLITPSLEEPKKIQRSDFCIVGSAEERESLISLNQNILIFPQIERSYLDVPKKTHVKKKTITLGYHGNPNHLNHFTLSLNAALEKISKNHQIELLIFKSKLSPMSDWVTEKPNIPIKYIDFNLNTFSKNIHNFDIGLVPNVSSFSIGKQDDNFKQGIYRSDLEIRFKNKSNIGRSLVLIQHGVPVVCDITPSNMSIFHDPNNGYAVLSKDGWYHAIKSLMSHEERNRIAQNAHKQYLKLYNPIDWAKNLHQKIKELHNERNNIHRL